MILDETSQGMCFLCMGYGGAVVLILWPAWARAVAIARRLFGTRGVCVWSRALHAAGRGSCMPVLRIVSSAISCMSIRERVERGGTERTLTYGPIT